MKEIEVNNTVRAKPGTPAATKLKGVYRVTERRNNHIYLEGHGYYDRRSFEHADLVAMKDGAST